MSKVKVAAFSVSLDGYGAGPDQSREDPLGKRGEELHDGIIPTKMFQKMYGKGSGTENTCSRELICQGWDSPKRKPRMVSVQLM